MKNFFGNLGYKIQQWMQGRYGNDELNRLLSIVALVFIVLSFFGRLWTPFYYAYIPGLILLVFEIYRSLSRNLSARAREREWYLGVTGKIRGFFNFQKRKANDKSYAYFKCPGCKTTIRVPKGRGKIEITCPKCRQKFIKRT